MKKLYSYTEEISLEKSAGIVKNIAVAGTGLAGLTGLGLLAHAGTGLYKARKMTREAEYGAKELSKLNKLIQMGGGAEAVKEHGVKYLMPLAAREFHDRELHKLKDSIAKNKYGIGINEHIEKEKLRNTGMMHPDDVEKMVHHELNYEAMNQPRYQDILEFSRKGHALQYPQLMGVDVRGITTPEGHVMPEYFLGTRAEKFRGQ